MTNIATKVTKMYGDFQAILKNISFQVKTAVATFWATLGKIWATINFSNWSHCG